MNFKVLIPSVLILILSLPAFAMTGREIMEKSDNLPQADTAMSKMVMRIHKGDRMEEKAFTLMMKQFENDEDKGLIEFIKPTQIKLLTHAHKGRDDDQWLQLSSGRVKRIASSSKGKPFVNSHLYYEDLSTVDIDDYEFSLQGEEKAVDEDCYKVEGVKTKGEKVYDKNIFYVRKSDFFVVRVDFYMDGEFHKYLENYDVKQIDGILTPHRATMHRADDSGRTELFLVGIKYNEQIPDVRFEKEALR